VEATAQVVSYNSPAEMYGQPMAMPERRISLDTVISMVSLLRLYLTVMRRLNIITPTMTTWEISSALRSQIERQEL
jgi:hypothetical protein